MKNYIIPFILGFLASSFLFLAALSLITIPEYIMIYQVECKRGTII